MSLLPWTMAAQAEPEPEPEPREAFPLSCLEGITSAPGFPVVEVQVNIHFIGATNNNFIPDDLDDPNDDNEPLLDGFWNGNLAARAMMERANLIMSNLSANPIGIEHFLGDSRIRFRLYSEASNANDKYGGIWYHQTMPDIETLPYGNKVVHIIVRDGTTGEDGSACGVGLLCNYLHFNNWYSRLENGPDFEDNWYGGAVFMAKVLVHEMGHITGLCHSFNATGQCSIDLDIEAECNIPGAIGGGGCDGPGCNNGASNSTNIMGYNGRSSSLSPCQWKIYYGRLLGGSPNTGKRAEFVKLGSCEDVGALPPITIASETTVTWSSPQVRCNAIRYPGSYGTYLSKNNKGLELKYNTYAGTPTFRDNTISGNIMNPADPGEIFSSQGTDGDPADNCFSAPDKAFGTIGFTTPFDYYVPFGAVNTPQCNVLPAALPPGIGLVFTTDIGGINCDNEDIPELPVFSKPELDLARQVATQTEATWQSHPSSSAYSGYQTALRQKNTILQSLLADALDTQNYSAAATLLAEEGTPEAQQWLLNVKLLAKDFTGAQQVWNALPSATQEEQWFRDIMEINLQRLQNMGGFSLSALQATQLYTIAYSESPYRSYARSLLVLLKEDRFPLDEGEEEAPLGEAPQPPQAAQVQTPVAEYSVAPNPASSMVQVRYPAGTSIKVVPKQLRLINMNGLLLQQNTLDDSGFYDLQTRDFPPGIYLLRITDKTGVLYQSKLVLLP